MGLTALICLKCGSGLNEIGNARYSCSYCRTKYIFEPPNTLIALRPDEFSKARINKLLKNAETMISLGEYQKAASIYEAVINENPESFRGWWGSFVTPIIEYFDTGVFNGSDFRHFHHAWQLSVDKSIFIGFFKEIISNYGTELRVVSDIPFGRYERDLCYHEISGDAIDDFTFWLIFESEPIRNQFPDFFRRFIDKLSEQLWNRLSKGSLLPLFHTTEYLLKPPPGIDGDWCRETADIDPYYYSQTFRQKLGYRLVGNEKGEGYTLSGKRHSICGIRAFDVCFGAWFLMRFENDRKWLRLEKGLTREDFYLMLGRCPKCGGDFKGFILKRCANCGKIKDY